MEHRVITAMEKALGWDGPGGVGVDFARGNLAEPGLTTRILTPHRLLDILMRRSLNTPQLRVFQGGEELHPNRYLVDEIGRRGQSIRMADTIKIDQLLRDGCTLVLDEVDVFDPTLEVMCRALQWWSHELVQVNAYLTTQEAAGFNIHWDDHDVIIFQLAGEKAWEVRGASREAPMYRDVVVNDEPSEEVLWTGTMKAGDVMHIPRGHWHQATRAAQGDGYSLHVTVGFVKRTGVTWADWVADQSRSEGLLRRDLDRWGTGEAWETQQADLADALARLAKERNPATFLRAREAERRPARNIPAADLFSEVKSVVCMSQFEPLIEPDGGKVTVVAAGKKLTFAARAMPALRLLLNGAPVDIEDADDDTRKISEILIREGLCAQATAESSSGYTGLVTAAKS